MTKPRITDSDLCRAAKRVGCSTAEIQTFLEVETKGRGFDAQDRPLILFERHWFHKLTGGQFDTSHPDISNPTPGGYGKSSEQYDRFDVAYQLDPQAAMKSASWGLGQVMGFNYAICGFASVGAFVDAMKASEGKQLDAAIEFIIHNNLDDELKRHAWRGFARGYNGSNYEKNNYHTKLADAYAKFSKQKIDCADLPNTAPLLATNPVLPTDVEPEPEAPAPASVTRVEQTDSVAQQTGTGTVISEQKVVSQPPKGDDPNVKPVQVSQNGPLAKWLFSGGGLASIGGAIWGFVQGNLNAVAVGIICLTLLIVVLIFRGALTDAIRMNTASNPDRKNVT